MENYQKEVGKVIIDDEAVESLLSVSSITNDNEGVLFIKMKPYKERGSQTNVIKRLYHNLSSIPGVNSFVSEMPLINLQVGTNQKGLYQYVLTSLDQNTLNQHSDTFMSKN